MEADLPPKRKEVKGRFCPKKENFRMLPVFLLQWKNIFTFFLNKVY